jgi:phosphopentomutase
VGSVEAGSRFCYSAGVINRVILIVLDGLGVGAAPDADTYGDAGANTLGHVAEAVGGLALPSVEALGLGHVGAFPGIRRTGGPAGCFGKMGQRSKGTDSISGHWEMAGLVLNSAFASYPDGLPAAILEDCQQAIGKRLLGNRMVPEKDVLPKFGEQHLQTGFPIVWTSAESVVRLAAHEQVVPVDDLYRMCRAVRKLLGMPRQVMRVVARPFRGEPPFVWTDKARGFPMEPVGRTLLDALKSAGQPVVGIGKIEGLFAGQGLTRAVPTEDDSDGIKETLRALRTVPRGLLFINLADCDAYSHRNDAAGSARVLRAFDQRLPELLAAMRAGDALVITADHGNDPTMPGKHHTREYVPLLIYGPRLARGVDLGVRQSFADIGQTVADALGGSMLAVGESFLDALRAA